MPAAPANSKSKSYPCEECGRILSRQDHLERHRLTAHSKRGALESTCRACGRKFSRRDVLVRHYRTVHGTKCESRPKGRPRKAPKPPVTQSPDYAAARSRSESWEAGAGAQDSQVDGLLDPQIAARSTSVALDTQWDMLSKNTIAEAYDPNGAVAASGANSSRMNDPSPFQSDPNFLNTLGGVQPFSGNASLRFDDIYNDISLLGWTLSEDPADVHGLLPELNMPDFPMQGLEDTLAASAHQRGMHETFEATDSYIDPAVTAATLPLELRNAEVSLPTMEDTVLSATSDQRNSNMDSPTEGELRADCSGATTHTWPYEYRAGAEEERIVLPALNPDDVRKAKDYHSGTNSTPQSHTLFNTLGKLDEAKRAGIVQLLSLPLVQVPWKEDIELAHSLPSHNVLDHFVNLYFLHFHELWPIIHQPTFKISDAPAILVLTMACIGACYSGLEKSIEFADTLGELCRRACGWLGEHDPRVLRSPHFGMALLLQYLHAMGSGSRRLFEMTDASRSRLISIGRHMKCTARNSSPARAEFHDRTTHQSWLEWVSQEQVKRLTWFLFEFDCLYSAFSKQSPCTKLEELPPEFPCEQLHWEAPTAIAWAACPFQASPCGPSTMQTIVTFLDTSSPSAIGQLDNVGKRLLIRCFGQQLQACQEQLDSSIYNAIWKKNDGRNFNHEARAKFSKAIISVYECSWADHPRRYALRHALRIGVAGHYTHMFAAGKIIDLVIRVARKRASSVDGPTTSIETVCASGPVNPAGLSEEKAMIGAFGADPETVRELMWHAAQVCYLQRRHPFNSPLEPLSVFLGGIMLWACCKYFCPHQISMRSGPSIQLDEPSLGSSQHGSRAVRDWIKVGGKTYLEGVGGVCDSGAPSRVLRLSVDQTRRLRVWKMASNVSDIFVSLLQAEEQDLTYTH